MAAPIVAAYSDSLGKVFLCAAPVALVGFVVSLFLKEVPLRQLDAISATDLGEGFGMPAGESSEKMLEVAVGRMFRDSPEIRLRSLAAQPGSRLDVALLWALIQIYRHDQFFGAARLTGIAERLRIPYEVIEADLQPAGGPRIRVAHRRSAGSDSDRGTPGQLRTDGDRRPHHPQTGAIADVRGSARPGQSGSRARTDRRPDAGAAGVV